MFVAGTMQAAAALIAAAAAAAIVSENRRIIQFLEEPESKVQNEFLKVLKRGLNSRNTFLQQKKRLHSGSCFIR
jgi:hypothetical protein